MTAFWTLLLGVAGAAVTAVLGFVGNPFRDETGLLGSLGREYDSELATKVVRHQWVGIVAFVIFGLLALWRVRRNGRMGRVEGLAYSALSVVGLLAVGMTGYLGGHVMD